LIDVLGIVKRWVFIGGKFDGTFWINLKTIGKISSERFKFEKSFKYVTQTYKICDCVSKLFASSSGRNLENKFIFRT
jgi:hypothetical protein